MHAEYNQKYATFPGTTDFLSKVLQACILFHVCP